MDDWIDVNEKVPDDSVEVLGLFQIKEHKYIDIVSFSTGYDGVQHWYFECPHIATSYKMNEQEVKHLIKWMPMPTYQPKKRSVLEVMNQLLPCKKCGYPDWRHLHYIHPEAWRISCTNCGYCTKEKKTKEEAEEAWNQR